MENTADSKQIILKFGLLTGIVSILISVVSYYSSNPIEPGLLLTALGFILPFTLIVFGIKTFKKNNGGYLKWAEAVKIGIGIAILWGLIALSFQYVLENIIDPNLIELKLEKVRETLENFGMDDDVIEESMDKQRNQSPLISIAFGSLFMTFLGFVVAAIAGAVMKKEQDVY